MSDDLINKLKCLRYEVSDAKEKNSDMIKQINEAISEVKPIVDETYEIKMPVPDDIKERVANDVQQLNYYDQLQQYGRIPEEYKSYDVDTNKPVFDVYKYYDINSRVPTITGEYGWAGSPGQIKMSSFQVPRIMSSDLKKRVKNDQELRYLRYFFKVFKVFKV